MFSEALVSDESVFVESLGAFLKHTRLQKNLTIEKVSQATKIRSHFLLCLENEDFEALPGTVYTTGFIRNYCDFLNVPSDAFVSLYLKQMSSIDAQSSFKLYLPNKPKKILTVKTVVLSLLMVMSVSVIWYALHMWQAAKENDTTVDVTSKMQEKNEHALAETKPIALEKEPQQTAKMSAELSSTREKSNDVILNLTPQKSPPVRDTRFDDIGDNTSPTSTHTPVETIDNRLDAIDETWVKIMDENGVRLAVKYLRKGESFSLAPYKDAYISVGDAEKVVYVQNTLKTPGSIYFGVSHGFVENQKIKVLPASDNNVTEKTLKTRKELIPNHIGR